MLSFLSKLLKKKDALVKVLESSQSKMENDLINKHSKLTEQEYRKKEILYYQKDLKEFGLSFSKLIEQSPKYNDTRQDVIKVAKILIENDDFKKTLYKKKKIPVKLLEQEISISRKTIERNHNYIIAIVIILVGDYSYLKKYLNVLTIEENKQ
ncbi:hypothetical protein [Bacillus sp. V2I10]|uniref:hypothetical protein n=1 Tax=Bacillus sp. V2I10 TaxID=3042276 RepID=UPI00277EC25C|nr:hypothetical protein [Bacillus sp. V2I10]MDQ0860010.1 RNA polymerase sigma-I factor [Bacillus sp. V2I10]